MTRRLYHEDPRCRTFQATVLSARPGPDGTRDLVLDRTAFYPTGGGQPHDRGDLDGFPVVDVLEEGESVVHRVRGDFGATSVTGTVDWDRRIDHRQQHTGQHILSAACLAEAKAETLAFHLGEVTCTIDLGREDLDQADLERAQAAANAVVLDDRPIRVDWFERPEDLPDTVRKEAPPVGRIRLVSVEDFDASPCCGTHCERTGQVGLIQILGTERQRGGLRVEFVCGGRALRDYARRHAALRDAARVLSTEVWEVPVRIGALVEEVESLQKQVRQLEATRLAHTERDLSGDPAALAALVDLGPGRRGWFPKLGPALAAQAGFPVLLASVDGDAASVCVAVPGDPWHAGRLLTALFEGTGGRGGGSAVLAQGKCAIQDLAGLNTRWAGMRERETA
mgnify:FL=1